jgi:hypothetical protein
MDKEHFDQLVGQLLILQPRADILKRQQSAMKHGRTPPLPMEDSLRLTPRDRVKTCEDCGKDVINRCVEISVKCLTTPYPYWQRHCLACDHKEVIRPKKRFLLNK